jgi:hypothetical protein
LRRIVPAETRQLVGIATSYARRRTGRGDRASTTSELQQPDFLTTRVAGRLGVGAVRWYVDRTFARDWHERDIYRSRCIPEEMTYSAY